MSEPKVRKRRRPSSAGHDPHRPVGYGNPPKATQYKKGVSGNPKGRPRKRQSSMEVIREVLEELVPVREAGGAKRIPSQKAIVTQLRNSALKGDAKARDQIIRLMQNPSVDGSKEDPAKVQSNDAAEMALQKELAALVGEDEQ